MSNISWGIIGCGDVTEVKSGPAFNKVPDSRLYAVMRRNANKAEDYAMRHHVPKWYSHADDLVNDPEVNAIYIATPPSSHEEYTEMAFRAGKPVYVEKPMTLDAIAALRMCEMTRLYSQKLVVAHYRRAQPAFELIKSWLDDEKIGKVRLVRSALFKKSLSREELHNERIAWRVDPQIAGGGLFHDLAPHQLDLMYFFFGNVDKAVGISTNQVGAYQADDIVSGCIQFSSGVQFEGSWCFNVSPDDERDEIEIIGSEGRIVFSCFDTKPVRLYMNGQMSEYSFPRLEHVQQPMIEKVVQYFLGRIPNPCSAEVGVEVMRLLDVFTGK